MKNICCILLEWKETEGPMTGHQAQALIRNLNIRKAGWRLPSPAEMQLALQDGVCGFKTDLTAAYWTGTPFDSEYAELTCFHAHGRQAHICDRDESMWVRLVRVIDHGGKPVIQIAPST